ncbi:MAG: hypothetical protein WCX61_02495 [Candidatus Peribacteraceae bacterium]
MAPQKFNKIRTDHLDAKGHVTRTTFEFVPVERVSAMTREFGNRLRRAAEPGVYVKVSPQTWEPYNSKKHDK